MLRLFRYSFILFVISMSAHGVQLAKDEPAEVLLFPFFGTENGWDTYVNIAGVDFSRQVAFKVRILDSVTGEVVKSLGVYPAANENWRISVSADGTGGSTIRIVEGDCTLDEDLNPLHADDTIDLPVSTGMIEVYGLGEFGSNLFTTCSDIIGRWEQGGTWAGTPPVDDNPAGRRVMGELYLVNVSEGLAATYTPTGLNNVVTEVEHSVPGTGYPSLAQADATAMINGSVVSPTSGEGIDAVAMVLSQNREYLVNDVITSAEINARTDWVFSYPLARYRHYKPFKVAIDGGDKFCEGFGNNMPTPGGPTVPGILGGANDVALWGQKIPASARLFGGSPTVSVGVRPTLCQAVNVVAYGEGESILVNENSSLLSPEPFLTSFFSNLDELPFPDEFPFPEDFPFPEESPFPEDFPFPGEEFPFPLEGFPDLPLTAPSSYTLRWAPYPQEYPADSGIFRPVLGFRMTVFQNGKLDGGETLGNYAVIRSHHRREKLD